MPEYQVSLMRYDVVPEKEADFQKWYEEIHIPDHLFGARPEWRRFRLCEIVPTAQGPEPLRPYADPTGHPKFLILLERENAPLGGGGGGEGQMSEGQRDFTANWLQHLRGYTTAAYKFFLEVEASDYGKTIAPGKRDYHLSLMRFDVVPEKEDAFNEWYDKVHIPELFTRQQTPWRAVRRATFSPPRNITGWQAQYALTTGQPKYLILLEREIVAETPPPGAPIPHGVHDFVTNWLPHLRNYTSIAYRCKVHATKEEFARTRQGH